uniref:Protein kinase domain-containing protein n=1 Tax=Oryzias latipes TaxID=8090 RepID=A0A3P9JY11_ORYLA
MDSSLSNTPYEVTEGFILLGRKGVYKVETFIGEGKVAKCKKLGTDQVVAIKIIWGSGQMEINALTITWQLIVALKGLKSINLVHCDIKLDNIMLVDQGSEPFRVKLIDFGLAEKIGHMRTGAPIQNICYRAPEVILGLPLDQRVDLWTVGYVLFEKVLNQGFYTTRFFTKTKENSQDVWKLDSPQQQSRKKGRLLVDLLKRMLMEDPSKRISPSEALHHPFFTMGRVQPTAGAHTTNPEEPPAVEVHPQPEAKEVTNTPQRPAAVSQECSSIKQKPGRIQQQRDAIKNYQAALQKRNPGSQQDHNTEKSLQSQAAFRRKWILKELVTFTQV